MARKNWERRIDGKTYEQVDGSSTKTGAKRYAETFRDKHPDASVRVVKCATDSHADWGVFARKRR